MPKEFSRSRRIGQLIHRELAALVNDKEAELGLGMITITAVDVSPDLRQAKVYVTQFGRDVDTGEVESVLNRASGQFRHELSHCLRAKSVPVIRFLYDRSIARAARVTELLNKVKNGA